MWKVFLRKRLLQGVKGIVMSDFGDDSDGIEPDDVLRSLPCIAVGKSANNRKEASARYLLALTCAVGG
jgi:hypothetical protein